MMQSRDELIQLATALGQALGESPEAEAHRQAQQEAEADPRAGELIARLDALCQKLADISGLPVFRVDEPEATALGLAFLLQDPGCGSPERTGIWFQPAANAVLAARCGRWRTAMARALRAAC